ncbi:MAG: GNAT family N-acetyltransferase [Actinomycetota bacterium]
MDVALSQDGQDFLRRDWTDLALADPHGTFFQTPRYLKLYWEEFGDEASLSLALAVDGDRTVGAGAFEHQGSTIRFLGGTEVTDYMGPVAVSGREPVVAVGMLEALARREDWSLGDFLGLAEDSAWIPALSEAAVAQGSSVQLEGNDVTPRLALPGTWDEYLSALPSKLRHELKRKARKLENDAGAYEIVISDADRLEEDLDRFVQLHRSSEGPKGKFMQPGMEIFFRRLGEAFLEDGIFRLAFLEIGGKRIAGAIGFVFHGTFSLYNSAFDHEWRTLSPGMVLVGELIRGSIEEGCHTFDMLKGGLYYNYRFGAQPRRLLRLQISKDG